MKKNLKAYYRSGLAPCEICKTPRMLEVHHIKGRKIIKCNESSNLVALCPNCHEDCGNSLIDIHGWAMTTKGRELLYQVL